MWRSRFTETQIIGMITAQEAGPPEILVVRPEHMSPSKWGSHARISAISQRYHLSESNH